MVVLSDDADAQSLVSLTDMRKWLSRLMNPDLRREKTLDEGREKEFRRK